MIGWIFLGIGLLLLYCSVKSIEKKDKQKEQEEVERQARVKALYPAPPREEEAEDG